ncbi:MAG: hypothetical protein K9G76_02035 [Bacteroidales bacterium]|nr:hypothetical protein [Bacteroidales bacterium]MCF8405663.1 hypothetical protein [Bacteroidales bacterium]
MKKLSLFFLAFMLLTMNTVKSQNESFMGLCLGTALPQGDFAKKDYNLESAGYANPGFLFTFDGTLFPDEYLGISATVSYGSNNPEKTKFKEDLINDVLGRYPNLEVLEDKTYFDYGVWRYLNFHAGPGFTARAGNINFDARFLAGLSLVWAPGQQVQIEWENDNNFSRKVDGKAIPTLGYTIGAGVRYSMKNGYVLRLITEYTNSKPTFDITEDLIGDIAEGNEIKTIEVSMPIKNIHIGIGIAYNFEL